LSNALKLADAAKLAGADAFKIQCWSPGTMCLDRGYLVARGPWKGRSLYDLYGETFLSWRDIDIIFNHCKNIGLDPFGSAFDNASVNYLINLGSYRIKIASFELVDIPLIRYASSKADEVIISTGMANCDEIAAAYDAADAKAIMLACTSAYPAESSTMNLRGLASLDYKWGLSDHTMSNTAPVVATALGAVMIEKHICLSRSDGGPDSGFALNPAEFNSMVQAVRDAASSLGSKVGTKPGETPELRRSLWVCSSVSKGDKIRFGLNVVTARPALGISPAMFDKIEGLSFTRDIVAPAPLTEDCFER
jgi:sialic acid synthase SpsE